MQKKVLISACLLGKNCRYYGGHSYLKELDELDVDWIHVCPEEAGDLGTPRPAAEMQGSAESILSGRGRVLTDEGQNVTEKFIQGAEKSLQMGIHANYAILKSHSPSCGVGEIFNGTFTNTLTDGNGIFAHLCSQKGIDCISSDNLQKIKKILEKQK